MDLYRLGRLGAPWGEGSPILKAKIQSLDLPPAEAVGLRTGREEAESARRGPQSRQRRGEPCF